MNRRANATLEAMTQSLYKHWFVDFAPFQGGNFVESELGPIPEGWGVGRLGDAVTIVKGKSYKSSELQPSNTALITLKSFKRKGGYSHEGLKPFTGKYKPEQKVYPGEVIIACTDITQNADVVGRAGIAEASQFFDSLVASLDVAIVRPNSHQLSNAYLYFLLNDPRYTDYIVNYANGSTVLHLDIAGLHQYRYLAPAEKTLTKFSAIAQTIFDQLFTNNEQNFTLAATRDYLLPKLLSGEIAVEAAEEMASV